MNDHDCRVCESEALKKSNDPFGYRFIVCPKCGNKRCPKASAHWQDCSGSNDDGQPRSFYGPRESWPTAAQAPGVAKRDE